MISADADVLNVKCEEYKKFISGTFWRFGIYLC
jgi:hypothetical protein